MVKKTSTKRKNVAKRSQHDEKIAKLPLNNNKKYSRLEGGASAYACPPPQLMHMFILQIYLYLYYLEKVLGQCTPKNAPSCPINKPSREYAAIPLNIV